MDKLSIVLLEQLQGIEDQAREAIIKQVKQLGKILIDNPFAAEKDENVSIVGAWVSDKGIVEVLATENEGNMDFEDAEEDDFAYNSSYDLEGTGRNLFTAADLVELLGQITEE